MSYTPINSKAPSVATLRKLFKANPELAPMAPYIGGGLKAVNYAFNVLDAAKTVAAPRGIEIAAIEIHAKNETSKKAVGEIAVANFILDALKQKLGLS
jgi:hypothetical protein